MQKNYYNETNNQGYLFKDSSKVIDGHYDSYVPHISIGRNLGGVVKNASFKKADAPYLRESRFVGGGIGGLTQLSNV